MTEPSGSIDFKGFVAGLAASAAATLRHVEGLLGAGGDDGATGDDHEDSASPPEPRDEQVRLGLSQARQLIDTMVMLEQKTQGNLTPDEQQLLRALLTELRISYVRVADGAKRAGPKPTS